MLSEKEIRHIAALARIGLNSKEVEKYQKDLSAVLDYFEKLQELDTEKVKPIGHITGHKNVMREDKADYFEEKDKIIKQFPDKKDHYAKVKSVF